MVWTSIRKLADAIRNDIVSGLRGLHQNMSLSVEQLEDEIVSMRLLVLKEYMMQGIIPVHDLLVSINCIPVDCESIDKCNCNSTNCGTDPIAHFEIPQLLFDFGLKKAIQYIGSKDKQHPFLVYTKPIDQAKTYQKYRKRGKKKPWVYIDVTPNSNGMLDCYIFEAPLIREVSVVGIFKDPRQLEEFQCNKCDDTNRDKDSRMDMNFNFIDNVVKDRLTTQKIKYYRQLATPILPNDQKYNAG